MLSYFLIFVLGSVSFLSDAYTRATFNSVSTGSLPLYAIAGILFFRTTPYISLESDTNLDLVDLVISAVDRLIQVSATKDIVLYKAPELAIFQPIPFMDYTPVQFVIDNSPKNLVVYKTPELAVYEPIAFRDYTPVQFVVDAAAQTTTIKDVVVFQAFELAVYESVAFRDYTPVQFVVDTAAQVPTIKDIIVFQAFELALFEPIPFRDYTPAQLVVDTSPRDLAVFKPFELALYVPLPFRDYPLAQSIPSAAKDLVVYKTAKLAVFETIPFRNVCPIVFGKNPVVDEPTTDIIVYQPDAFDLAVASPIHALPSNYARAQSAAIAIPFYEAWLAGSASNTTDLVIYQHPTVSRTMINTVSHHPTSVSRDIPASARVHPLVNLYSALACFDGTFSGAVATCGALDPVWRCALLVFIVVDMVAATRNRDGRTRRRTQRPNRVNAVRW